jgi:hypothetical protein
MSDRADTRITTTLPPSRRARDLIRWVCTSNPFHVLSAGLFLLGLWISFGAQTRDDEAFLRAMA